MKNIVVITNPMIAANRSTEVTLSKFLRVIKPSVDRIQVIGGNISVEPDLADIEVISYPIVRYPNKIRRVLSIVCMQLKMMGAVMMEVKKGQPVYFWIADKMIFPYIAAKLKRAEANYFIYGNVAKEGAVSGFTRISSKLIRFMAVHADYVGVESRSVINEWPGLCCKALKVIHLYTENTEMYALEKRRSVFGMVCRLTPGKHVIECIEAMYRIHAQHPEWSLEIIGSGKQEQECLARISALKAEDYIKMLGWVNHDEIAQRAAQWKYLLFPTDTEGMPNGLIEMMGQGIPALASPVGGIIDVVDNGLNGFVLPETSTDEIEKKMQEMIAVSSESYAEMANNAYIIVKNNYSLEAAQNLADKELQK